MSQRADGEVIRLGHHALDLITMAKALLIGLEETVSVVEAAQAIAQLTSTIVAVAARADAYRRAEEDARSTEDKLDAVREWIKEWPTQDAPMLDKLREIVGDP